MRQLCNLTYTALTREMAPKELDRFNAELNAHPQIPGQRSSGTRELMAVMRGMGAR